MSTLLIIAQVITVVIPVGTFIGAWAVLHWLEDHYGKTEALLFTLVALAVILYSNIKGAPL